MWWPFSHKNILYCSLWQDCWSWKTYCYDIRSFSSVSHSFWTA